MKPNNPRTDTRHNLHIKVESRTHKYTRVDPKLVKKCSKSELSNCLCKSKEESKSFLKRAASKLLCYINETKKLNEKQSVLVSYRKRL